MLLRPPNIYLIWGSYQVRVPSDSNKNHLLCKAPIGSSVIALQEQLSHFRFLPENAFCPLLEFPPRWERLCYRITPAPPPDFLLSCVSLEESRTRCEQHSCVSLCLSAGVGGGLLGNRRLFAPLSCHWLLSGNLYCHQKIAGRLPVHYCPLLVTLAS